MSLSCPDEESANFNDKLRCLVRSFILLQAYSHQSFDHTRMLVSLPSIKKSYFLDPRCKLHKNCLTSPLATIYEEKELKLDERSLKFIEKYIKIT